MPNPPISEDFLQPYPAVGVGEVGFIPPPQPPKANPLPKRASIKDWAEDDKPREKFMLKGKGSVSDAELIAILLGSGTDADSAVDVARKLLALAGGSLDKLGKLDYQQLKAVRGIGDARAVTVAAALELGRRRKEDTPAELPIINSPEKSYELMRMHLQDVPVEQFWIILLNRGNRLIRTVKMSEGGVSAVIADPKIIFKTALLETASNIIVVHNHPSGQRFPSGADDEITRNLVAAGNYLHIPVLDHLIYTDAGYYSYADNGRI